MPKGSMMALTTFALLIGCSGSDRPENPRESATGEVLVYTVNYPLKYFADRIGGEHVRVVFPAPTDVDPAYWTPDAETVSAYQQAELILLNGATYAKWVPKVTLPRARFVNTSGLVKDKYIAIKNAITHSHGPGEQHSHDGTAFTVWLNPELAIAQAEAIRQALSDVRPAHKETFSKNFDSLKSDLQALDDKLAAAVSQGTGQPVVFSHPVFQYLTGKYDLNAKSVHWEPDSSPADVDWENLREMLSEHPAKWMIWEAKPIEESVQRLAELGISSVVFDPCGNTPDGGDWLQAMNDNADALARVFASTDNPTESLPGR